MEAMSTRKSAVTEGDISGRGRRAQMAQRSGQTLLAQLGGCLLVLLLLCGCQTSGKKAMLPVFTQPPGQGEALVSMFVQLSNDTALGVWLQLASVELLGDGGVFPLTLPANEISGHDVAGRQRFLGRGLVRAGRYSAVRVSIEKAGLLKNGEKNILAIPNPVIDLPLPGDFQLDPQSSFSLFLSWDEDGSIASKALLVPKMAIIPQEPPMLADLAFVSCPDIDTVFTLRTDTNRVSGSFAIPGRPTSMAYAADRKKLYVLGQENAEISVVKVSARKIYDRFKIPLTVNPTYMISPDGRWGYILDKAGNHLLRMDLVAGSLSQRVRLGYEPRYLAWLAGSGRLALSSGLSQQVYIVEPESLSTVESITVGNTPDGLLDAGDSLYVAESAANSLSIYDLRTRQLLKRMNVGFGPRRMLKSNNQIYVSNFLGSSVSLLLDRQQRLLRNISVGDKPLEMAASDSRKWLYVAEQGTGKITVIDQTANRVITDIELGAVPQAIVVAQ